MFGSKSVVRRSSNRRRTNRRRDGKVFSHTAGQVHSANARLRPMRGGYRI